jgi:hypothetical protein
MALPTAQDGGGLVQIPGLKYKVVKHDAANCEKGACGFLT